MCVVTTSESFAQETETNTMVHTWRDGPNPLRPNRTLAQETITALLVKTSLGWALKQSINYNEESFMQNLPCLYACKTPA